jgi:hypothetical protein
MRARLSVFSCNMGMMVEDAFFDICGRISHTILGDVARMFTAKTDAVLVLCVASIKIIISCSRHTLFASIMMHFVCVQKRFFFDGRVNRSEKGRSQGFVVPEFFECNSDFFDRRFRCAKQVVCAKSSK